MTETKESMQNCLPGVTIYDCFGRSRNTRMADDNVLSLEKNISPWHHNNDNDFSSSRYYRRYREGSYQSLHVEAESSIMTSLDDNSSSQLYSEMLHLDWIEEQKKLQNWHSWRRWYLCCLVVLVAFIFAKYQTFGLLSDHDVDDDMKILHHSEADHRKDILQALEKLDENLDGAIVLHSSKPKFVEAAKIWRQDLESPLAVIEATTQDDVILALPVLAGLARDFGLQFAVRSGGYSPAGYGTTGNSGVVLSLAKLEELKWRSNNSTTSSDMKTVVVEPGVRVEDFMQQLLDQNGYAGVVPDAARIGMGGFVLGGGFGLLSRQYGLGIDNVVRLRVVLTSGIVQDVEQGDELFWALLGSGGVNFGVVTEIEYKIYPCDDMKLAANVRLPMQEAVSFLQKLGTAEKDLDRKVAVRLHGFQPSQGNDTLPISVLEGTTKDSLRSHDRSKTNKTTEIINGTTEITMYWMGKSDPETQAGMNYLKQHLEPFMSASVAQRLSYYYMSWSAMTRAKEQPASWRSIWAAQSWNGFLHASSNTPGIWNDLRENFLVVFRYAPHVTPTIDLWGGAIAKVPANGTAFPHRKVLYHVRLDLLVPKHGKTTIEEAQEIFAQESALVTAVWPSIAIHLKGAYTNYPMPSLSSKQYPQKYWGGNLNKLTKLKEQYDPFHILQYEQSIPLLANQTSNNGQQSKG